MKSANLCRYVPPFQLAVETQILSTGHLAPKNDPDIRENNRKTGRFPHGPIMGGVLNDLVKPGQSCLDVGAFIGDNTLEFTQYGLRTIAIEPFLDAHECAKKNAPDAIHIHAAAGNGELVQLEYRCHSDNHGMRSVKPYPKGQGYPFQSLRIDDLELDSLHLLKIDAEGSEPRILEGARNTIARFRPVLFVEANEHFLGDGGQAMLKQMMEAMGYTVSTNVSGKVLDWLGVPK